jgi:membrane protein
MPADRSGEEGEQLVPRIALVERGWRFFAHTVWEDRCVRARGFAGLTYRCARIGYLTARGFVEDQVLFRAMALTYISVLSLVPLLAFSFSVAKGFGFYHELIEKTVNPFLDRTFGPLEEQGPLVATAGAHEMRVAIAQVLELVGNVIAETKVTGLGALGLAILAWTVIKLLSTIERSFNDIWGVQRSRSLLRKVSDYLAMVIVTPIFLFTATGLTTAAQNSGVVEFLRGALHLGPFLDLVLEGMPLIALWIGFSFLYMAMPNARTRIVSAMLGALVGGTLWQILLVVHLRSQVEIARYSAIYAGFAAIPIFLIWVDLAWVAVLLGAEVCFAHQSEPAWARLFRSGPADHAFQEVLGLRSMARIGERFLAGGEAWTAERLADELGAPQRLLEKVLDRLVAHGLLRATLEGKAEGFVPARDLETMTVKTVLDALKGSSGTADVTALGAVDQNIDRLLAGLDHEVEDSRQNRTIRSLAEVAAKEREGADAKSALSPRSA